MRLSIGILAWDEEALIGKTIESLFRQTLFTVRDRRVESIEVICVPNGCTDNTTTVAQEAFRRCQAELDLPQLCCRIEQIPEAGKANAWNRYVHEFSDQSADYLMLMDADVLPREQSALVNLIEALEGSPQAHVATPRFVKDIALKPRKTLFDRMSLACSRMNAQVPALLAGGLYCARGQTLREIWLPRHLLVEDGFLRALILTDQFRSTEDFRRVVRASGATVVFEAYTTLGRLLRHERRVITGTVMNTLLFGELVKYADQPGLGRWIRQQNLTDPDWAVKLVQTRCWQQGYWLVLRGAMFRRFRLLKHSSPAAALKRLPLALAGFLFDLPIFFGANRALRRGCIRGAW